jgi:hypothetical protein
MKQIVQQTFSCMDAESRQQTLMQMAPMRSWRYRSNGLTTAFSIFLVCGSMVASFVAGQPAVAAEARVERNVVYGMYSGLALLMDVYHPASRNGIHRLYTRQRMAFPSGLQCDAAQERADRRTCDKAPGRGRLHCICNQPPAGSPLPLSFSDRRRTAGCQVCSTQCSGEEML